MKLSDITTLGRVPIDPSYPTNRAIAALTLVVALAAAGLRLFSGGTPLESVQWGIEAGLVVFLTWAVGRELDPENDLSAFVGVGLIIIALFLVELPSLLLILWLLMALRLVNRTVGLPARPLDSLGVLGLGAWLTWQGTWLAGLLAAVAFLLDGLLPPPLRRHLFASGLALLLTAILSLSRADLARGGEPSLALAISSLAVAALFLIVITTSRQVQAVGDATGEPLNPRRVQAAQALALLAALLFVWWDGIPGAVALLPLWAAMVGAGLYRVAVLFVSRRH